MATMKDTLYYSHTRVTLENIQHLAEELGYSCVIVSFDDSSANLTISFGGEIRALRGTKYEWIEDHWYVDEVTASEWEEAAEYEEEDVYTIVNSYHPRSMFTVGYHQEHLPELANFLHVLLTRYGGQVMMDSGSVYNEGDVQNIIQHTR